MPQFVPPIKSSLWEPSAANRCTYHAKYTPTLRRGSSSGSLITRAKRSKSTRSGSWKMGHWASWAIRPSRIRTTVLSRAGDRTRLACSSGPAFSKWSLPVSSLDNSKFVFNSNLLLPPLPYSRIAIDGEKLLDKQSNTELGWSAMHSGVWRWFTANFHARADIK